MNCGHFGQRTLCRSPRKSKTQGCHRQTTVQADGWLTEMPCKAVSTVARNVPTDLRKSSKLIDAFFTFFHIRKERKAQKLKVLEIIA